MSNISYAAYTLHVYVYTCHIYIVNFGVYVGHQRHKVTHSSYMTKMLHMSYDLAIYPRSLAL